MSNTERKIKLKIDNFEIEIIDHTELHKEYCITKFIARYLKVVPKEDLKGLSKIHIYDDSPSHFPKDKAGGYYPPSTLGNDAGVDIFLNQLLGYMLSDSEKNRFFVKVSNKIFLMSFGKAFIADVLYHEIGHHKYIPREGDNTQEAAEEYAKKYANELLWKTYPFLPRYYNLVNFMYKFFYRKRIKKAGIIGSKIPVFSSDYFYNKGRIHLTQNEFEAAIKEFDHAIELNPNDPNAYFNRGFAKGHLGKYRESIEDFTSALNLNPSDSNAYYNRAYSYHHLDEYEKAAEDYTKAIEYDSSYADAYANRSRCHEALNNKKKAEEDLQEAVKRGFDIKEEVVKNGSKWTR